MNEKIGLDCILNGPSPTFSVTHAVRMDPYAVCVNYDEMKPGFNLLTLFVEGWWEAFGTFLNPETNSFLLEGGGIIAYDDLKNTYHSLPRRLWKI